MSKRKSSKGKQPDQGPPQVAKTAVQIRRAPGGQGWELVHPRCARDRQDDMREVYSMLEMGEVEVAVDELRWLLEDCSDFIEAHKLLGEAALADEDLPLARGHFGYAYTAAVRALPAAGLPGPLPYSLPANQHFFEAAKGLAYCLIQLEKPDLARDVLQQMLTLDPSDPLDVEPMLDELDEEKPGGG